IGVPAGRASVDSSTLKSLSVTLAGLLLGSAATTPAGGAAPGGGGGSCGPLPPLGGGGVGVCEASAAGGRSWSVCRSVMLRAARIVTSVATARGWVVIVKVALFAAAGMVTRAGTEARAGLVLPSVITAPSGPATKVDRSATVGHRAGGGLGA